MHSLISFNPWFLGFCDPVSPLYILGLCFFYCFHNFTNHVHLYNQALQKLISQSWKTRHLYSKWWKVMKCTCLYAFKFSRDEVQAESPSKGFCHFCHGRPEATEEGGLMSRWGTEVDDSECWHIRGNWSKQTNNYGTSLYLTYCNKGVLAAHSHFVRNEVCTKRSFYRTYVSNDVHISYRTIFVSYEGHSHFVRNEVRFCAVCVKIC